ncbi:unnamed protein product, partial [Iphiclides podalirius]
MTSDRPLRQIQALLNHRCRYLTGALSQGGWAIVFQQDIGPGNLLRVNQSSIPAIVLDILPYFHCALSILYHSTSVVLSPHPRTPPAPRGPQSGGRSALTTSVQSSGTRPRRPVARTVGSASGGIGARDERGTLRTQAHLRRALVPIHPPSESPSPAMSRAGARHPDADERQPSGSTSSSPEGHQPAGYRGDDVTEPHVLYATLNEYLQLEQKFQPRLCLPDESESGEVTIGARDGAAHVLRCLKVWFDLPADVLISAINLFDRFLTKMKVRPCHVPCITVSCMNVALDEHAENTQQPRKVSVEELVSVSQSACTWRDVARMSRVLADKLALNNARAVTPLHWLRLLRSLAANAALPAPPESELVNLLEIAICDAGCANARTSELALVIVYHQLEKQLTEWARHNEVSDDLYYLYEFASQLQAYCNMSDASLVSTRDTFRSVLSRYEARCAAPQRQRLVWRLSERTLKVLRPTDRLTSLLPTIEEQHFAVDPTPSRNRSGSESSESEETSDWPRSPVLPVYCSN